MTLRGILLAIAVGLSGMGSTAAAGDLLAGVYAHDLGPADRESGADFLLGWQSAPLENLDLLFHPAVHVIAVANTDVSTDFIAAGFDWKVQISRNVYLRPGMGLAYTTGKAGLPAANAPGLTPAEYQRRLHLFQSRIDFGSNILFEPELAVGYQISKHLAVEGSYVHLSNGQIFHHGKNQGLDDLGVRLVYGF